MDFNRKAILFDCDGTLVDSEILAMELAINTVSDETQKQVPGLVLPREARDDLMVQYAGWHLKDIIQAFERNYGVSFDVDALNARIASETLQVLQSVKPVPHILPTLSRLAQEHRHVALVTSSAFDRVDLCLEKTGVGQFFPKNKRYSASDSLPQKEVKPNPAIYNYTHRMESILPDQAIAVEDSIFGVLAARYASMTEIIGYVGGSHIPNHMKKTVADNLLDHGAAIVLWDMRDLPTVVSDIEKGVIPSHQVLNGHILMQGEQRPGALKFNPSHHSSIIFKQQDKAASP